MLLHTVRYSLRGFEESLSAIDALRGLQRGKIRIATVESVSVTLLPDLLATFAARYPGIEIAVTVTGSEAVANLVRAGEADLGFTFNPGSLAGMIKVYERALPVGALLSPSHPLAHRRRLLLADCLNYPLALPSRGLSLRGILDTALARRKDEVPVSFEANSLRLMSALAKRQRCIAFQTEVGIEQELAAKSLVFIPLADPHLPFDRFTIIQPAGRKATHAAAAFLRESLPVLQAKQGRKRPSS
jgi:DNA-binding transcriptional LysR family regulator